MTLQERLHTLNDAWELLQMAEIIARFYGLGFGEKQPLVWPKHEQTQFAEAHSSGRWRECMKNLNALALAVDAECKLLAEAREALVELFAETAETAGLYDEWRDDEEIIAGTGITIGHVRKARTVLAKLK